MDKPKKYEDLLMEALDFTEADLEANQAGVLSPNQRARLSADARKARQWVIAAGVVATIFIITTVMAVNPIGQLLNGLTAAIAALICLMFVRRFVPLSRAARGGVEQVEGRAQLDTDSKEEMSNAYYLLIDEAKFKLKKRQFLTFKSDDPSRVYYAPKVKRILSAEWLRDDSPFVDQSTAHERLIDGNVEQTVGRGSQRIAAEDDEIAPLSRRDASP